MDDQTDPGRGETPVATTATMDVVRAPRRGRRWLRWVLLAVVVACLGVELDVLGPYLSRATDSLSDADPRWLLVAVAAELCSMAAFARVQRRMLSAGGPRVSVYQMIHLTYAANAVSVTLPGGSALSTGYTFRRLRAWGASGPAAGFTLLASGVLSTLSFAVLTVVVALVAGNGVIGSVLVLVLVGVVGVVVWCTRHVRKIDAALGAADWIVARANRVLRRPADSGRGALTGFAAQLAAIRPRGRDWLAGLGFAELNWVADLGCLLACCRAVGASGSTVALVMIAYVAGMSASSVSLLPGGLGVVDAAMIFALVQGGVSTVLATAGVLLYRLISFALIVAMGWIAWVVTWWSERAVRSLAVRAASAGELHVADVATVYATPPAVLAVGLAPQPQGSLVG